ncbi:hypothetical protein POJ06DRAFT_260817 [Lipomyces tetrasporus]|uniref:Mug135-like C-terminal domain-containing protein n=1 Tax=Lipomyces tetrasporus TaxID=54092 RepID=A0AAD7QMI0_9ASCO|nr:uncharacterized protein POJ06DRAFT_260817 [Lipomyces tetrasporus]KAJ8098052.1 hypothetical protein POJ06DRAFT_260817 [Lipomyces tetrasporus]
MDDEQMIAPPQLRDSVPVKVPRRPQEPPSEQDLAASRAYYGQLRALRDEGGLDDDSRPNLQEMVDANRYLVAVEDKIRETRGDSLREILRVVNEMRQAQTETRQVQTEILNRLDHFTRMQNISVIAPLKQANKDRDGVRLTLNIIPFADGSMPTQHPHNLPPLFTVEAINGLE